MYKRQIQIDKTRKIREICVDFVSKKVYSIQALNERASQTSQRNEKSTDRKKKVLDRMTRLWYSDWVAAEESAQNTRMFEKSVEKTSWQSEMLVLN